MKVLTRPPQQELFDMDADIAVAPLKPRLVEPVIARPQLRVPHAELQQETLVAIRSKMLECLSEEKRLPHALHMLMRDPIHSRSYRLILSMDLFGRIVLDRQWGSLVTRRGGSKRMSFDPHQRDLVRKLLLRIFSVRERHHYELIAVSGI